MFFELRADFAVNTVSADHEVVRAKRIEIEYGRAKVKIYSQFAAALLQNVKNFEPRNARKLIAANGDLLVEVDDIDVIPRFELLHDPVVRWLVFRFEIA